MLNPYDASSISPTLSTLPGRNPTTSRTDGSEQPFSQLLTADPPTKGALAGGNGLGERVESEEIAKLRRDREAYQSQREAEIRRRPQEPYPAIQIAIPVNDAGYQPFITADQQKMIDSITDRYIGKPEHEFEKMWAELNAKGLAPDQLVKSAKYFINDAGDIVDRAAATRSAGTSGKASTVWSASEVE